MCAMSFRSNKNMKVCAADGCDRSTLARGLCSKHYQSARTAGVLPPKREAESIAQRLRRGMRMGPGCWDWTMAKDTAGYGLVTVATGRSRSAHRESYRCFVGDIPSGLSVCHSCDNPACVRPSHLFLGTHGDNMRDASRKGRMCQSLTWGQVRLIRSSPLPAQALANQLGVGKHVIYKCRQGRTYASELLEMGDE